MRHPDGGTSEEYDECVYILWHIIDLAEECGIANSVPLEQLQRFYESCMKMAEHSDECPF